MVKYGGIAGGIARQAFKQKIRNASRALALARMGTIAGLAGLGTGVGVGAFKKRSKKGGSYWFPRKRHVRLSARMQKKGGALAIGGRIPRRRRKRRKRRRRR